MMSKGAGGEGVCLRRSYVSGTTRRTEIVLERGLNGILNMKFPSTNAEVEGHPSLAR